MLNEFNSIYLQKPIEIIRTNRWAKDPPASSAQIQRKVKEEEKIGEEKTKRRRRKRKSRKR